MTGRPWIEAAVRRFLIMLHAMLYDEIVWSIHPTAKERPPVQKIAFCMQLNPGCEVEYKARHDALWPDLCDALRQAGVRDYSIHLEPETGRLFATLWRSDDHRMDDLPNLPVMKRWWAHMADLMQTEPSGAPVQTALEPMFHLE
jgi:L-rhamnose mutarotase